jgi:hypothetical protein
MRAVPWPEFNLGQPLLCPKHWPGAWQSSHFLFRAILVMFPLKSIAFIEEKWARIGG